MRQDVSIANGSSFSTQAAAKGGIQHMVGSNGAGLVFSGGQGIVRVADDEVRGIAAAAGLPRPPPPPLLTPATTVALPSPTSRRVRSQLNPYTVARPPCDPEMWNIAVSEG